MYVHTDIHTAGNLGHTLVSHRDTLSMLPVGSVHLGLATANALQFIIKLAFLYLG